jgi:ribonucleoside-diphosphate reductase alpha chain
MRMLDNVIDANFYPTKEAYVSNMRHRPVGLGIMGFQDALYVQRIPFDTEACIQFADTSMEMISYYAILASSDLARERGAYETFVGSKWDRGLMPVDTLDLLEKERGVKIDVPRTTTINWNLVRESIKKHGMRNSNCLAMAPTATISNIAGCTPTIEPIYKNIYVKSNVSGDFIVINPYLVTELKKLNLWDDEMLGKIKYNDGIITNIPEIPQSLKDIYKEVFEVNPRWLIRSAAYRGKWIDQSQSLNIFYSGKSGRDLNDIYFYAWEMGLKTTYYLRSLAMSQVEKSTVSTDKFGSTHTRKQGGNMGAGESMEVSVASISIESTAGATPRASAAPSSTQPQTQTITQTQTQTQIKVQESTPAPEIKLCKINDPNCEACQ